MRRFKRFVGSLVCRLRRRHANAVCTYSNRYLVQLICPRCGAFALFTQSDLEKGIIEALTKGERYTNVERIA